MAVILATVINCSYLYFVEDHTSNVHDKNTDYKLLIKKRPVDKWTVGISSLHCGNS